MTSRHFEYVKSALFSYLWTQTSCEETLSIFPYQLTVCEHWPFTSLQRGVHGPDHIISASAPVMLMRTSEKKKLGSNSWKHLMENSRILLIPAHHDIIESLHSAADPTALFVMLLHCHGCNFTLNEKQCNMVPNIHIKPRFDMTKHHEYWWCCVIMYCMSKDLTLDDPLKQIPFPAVRGRLLMRWGSANRPILGNRQWRVASLLRYR